MPLFDTTYTLYKSELTRYIPNPWLNPPASAQPAMASVETISMPLRLHVSASMPAGMSSKNVLTAISAVSTPMPIGSMPMLR